MRDETSYSTAHRLVTWYEQHRRDLPWRRTRDPYAIWLSETMLQQTRVETVIPYYHEFLRRFPSVGALAAAEEADVLKMWQGLGYYSRARNLHQAARLVVERYGGRIPDDEQSLSELPGVGPYTRGAVLSIAFDQPVPAVDGNVLRVMARFLGIDDPIQSPAVTRRVQGFVAGWLAETRPSQLTQALMELGALVCVPRQPRCAPCPLQENCVAFQTDRTQELPVRAKARPRREVVVVALWCEDARGVLLEQRPGRGLLARLWQLPAIELPMPLAASDEKARQRAAGQKLADLFAAGWTEGGEAAATAVAESGPRAFALVGRDRHVFSHVEWEVFVYRPLSLTAYPTNLPEPYRFARLDDLRPFALPRVYERLLRSIPAGRNPGREE
ncbi:A/G-specific adenine glycosylase [Alicyclobacillus kakegawensis]|uniref:A/G-specific adenine glycosylase n=1 Tax=Alicyclobacillus kakegawensis TaxID=392012 RepID=UPI00082C706A|nr:A/G-specific adenine glycosylase [Alicyclobacillus kakegawensis]